MLTALPWDDSGITSAFLPRSATDRPPDAADRAGGGTAGLEPPSRQDAEDAKGRRGSTEESVIPWSPARTGCQGADDARTALMRFCVRSADLSLFAQTPACGDRRGCRQSGVGCRSHHSALLLAPWLSGP